MNQTRYAGKVGLFIAIGLVLVALLLLSFSKGLSFLTPTYNLSLKAISVGGLKKNANVLLSGVPVGRVSGFDVAPEGIGVLIQLEIEERYHERIHADARFGIEQLGLLGDQYIEITPLENKAPVLQKGQTIDAQEPMSLQETARSAKDLIALASKTLTSFNHVMDRIDTNILSERALTNLSGSLEQFRQISEQAAAMVNNINNLVQTNTPAITSAVTNLSQFSTEMQKLANEMTVVVASNRLELTKGVRNLEQASEILQRLGSEIEAGKGAVGLVLKDAEFRYNVSVVASNLQVFSQHLNEHGLLHNLFYKPKVPKKADDKSGDK